MSDYVPDDVHSLISLSSSTIGSTRAEDIESISDSPDNIIQDVDINDELSTANLSQNKSDVDVFRRDSIPIEPAKDAFDRDPENKDEEQGEKDGRTEENPFLKSVKYLEQHAILRLFQSLAADIVYNRPEQPLRHIVDKLKAKHTKDDLERTDDTQKLGNENGDPPE